MIAHVVPVIRLRRATTWWSYRVPPRAHVSPGSLVVIPLRGRSVPGIVWAVDDDQNSDATDRIEQILVSSPLIRTPARNFLEWLAESSSTSLSTACYLNLPSLLRSWPYRKPTLEALKQWRALEKPVHQQLFLLPFEREDVISALQKASPESISWFAGATETEELSQWLQISAGSVHTVIGRERGVFTNFANLTSCVIQDPEDVSYYHEQTPYLPMTEAALHLATCWGAEKTVRSAFPEPIQSLLWPDAIALAPDLVAKQVVIKEIRQKEIINDELVSAVRTTLAAKKEVVILYNAKDRLQKTDSEPFPLLIPGIETLRTKLALRLEAPTLPTGVHFDTRAVFKRRYTNVGLTVALNIDPVLYQQNFADEFHGWADLYKLLSYPAPLIVQTGQPENPALLALREHRLTSHLLERIQERKDLELPPFCTTISCSIGTNQATETEVATLSDLLREKSGGKWRVSAPAERRRRAATVWVITLHASAGTLLPQPLRQKLASLTRPWKVERNPWYAL